MLIIFSLHVSTEGINRSTHISVCGGVCISFCMGVSQGQECESVNEPIKTNLFLFFFLGGGGASFFKSTSGTELHNSLSLLDSVWSVL